MKHLLLFLLLITISFCSRAQYVIYICESTGAFGAGFNNDNAPTSYQECADFAHKKCREAGGTSCQLMRKNNKAGWCAFITGELNGRIYFQGGDGYNSKSEAESAVRAKYRSEGGSESYKVQVYSWYAYSNLKY